MHLVKQHISKDGSGYVTLRPQEDEDIWHAYNLITQVSTSWLWETVSELVVADPARLNHRAMSSGRLQSGEWPGCLLKRSPIALRLYRESAQTNPGSVRL